MKKRNLFLSLICSIILTVALATTTIIGVVSNNKKPNTNQPNVGNVSDTGNVSDPTVSVDKNADRDGSAEKPYLIYDAESFIKYVSTYGYTAIEKVLVPEMVDALDEQGNVVLDENGVAVKTEKLDENGNVVMIEKVDEEGNVVYNDSCYFELANDIDFAGVEYVTLFNQKLPFNGHLNGKNFALKNVSISVNKANVDSFLYKDADNYNRYDANIALFGKVDGAEIIDITVENISVNVADEVYTYVADGFSQAHDENSVNGIKVATVAAVAKNSTIKANVSGAIVADAYALVVNNNPVSNAAVGGVVGVAVSSTISDSNVDVDFTASCVNKVDEYSVGGIAGHAYYSTIKNMNVKLDVLTTYEQKLYIGGAFGYVVDSEFADSKISLAVAEKNARGNFGMFTNFVYTDATWVAGIAPMAKAAEEEKINISNISVNANVDIDVVYAGAVVEVTASSVAANVNFKNVIVNSNVNVLEGFGFARCLNGAAVVYEEGVVGVDENNYPYHTRIVGKIILAENQATLLASVFEKDYILNGDAASLILVVSENIYNKVVIAEEWKLERLENIVVC